MRGLVPGLPSPHPLGAALPAVYATAAGDGAGTSPAAAPYGTYTVTIGAAEFAAAPDLPGEARGGLAGTWVLALHEPAERTPSAVALSFFRDGRPYTTGILRVARDGVVVTTASCGSVEGSYAWRFDGDSLAFTSVEDVCASRRVLLTAARWRLRSLVLRLMTAFDEELAPILCTLDNLEAYVDPRLAPTDFVDWLSGWIGLSPTQRWPLERRRRRIERAVPLATSWATADAIKEVVAIFAGIGPADVEVTENGAVAVSPTAGAELPGSPEPRLTVRVKVPDAAQIELAQLERVVTGAKPAHMVHELEVVTA